MYLVLFIILLTCVSLFITNNYEEFDDYVNRELQERAGPMEKSDEIVKKLIDQKFPTIPSYFVPFRKFYVEIFEDINLKTPLTALRDSSEQFLSIKTRKPIRSIRIRSVPNKNWRFLQFFTVGIFLEKDRSKGLVLHVPEGAESVDYQILDTMSSSENLQWLNNDDTKIIYYTINYYDPMIDLTL